MSISLNTTTIQETDLDKLMGLKVASRKASESSIGSFELIDSKEVIKNTGKGLESAKPLTERKVVQTDVNAQSSARGPGRFAQAFFANPEDISKWHS